MDNSSLNTKAKELESELKVKLKCYCVVGWMRHPDVGIVFTVYVDVGADVDAQHIPSKWHGYPVFADQVTPLGQRPPEPTSAPW